MKVKFSPEAKLLCMVVVIAIIMTLAVGVPQVRSYQNYLDWQDRASGAR